MGRNTLQPFILILQICDVPGDPAIHIVISQKFARTIDRRQQANHAFGPCGEWPGTFQLSSERLFQQGQLIIEGFLARGDRAIRMNSSDR